MPKIIIVWGLWGPYHCRRFEAFRDHAAREGSEVIGVSLFSGSRINKWGSANLPEGVIHFDLGDDETKCPPVKIAHLLKIPGRLDTDVALLPSYFHWSLVLNAGARLTGARVVMMNESHAGTARAQGLKALFKKWIVAGFHAGFVGGEPQRRYFASMGLPSAKIFTGYDVVDNDYFAQSAREVQNQQSEFRRQYNLPNRFILSLGRFAAKKNLETLLRAYRKFLDSAPQPDLHLVMVGSGEEEDKLGALCAELQLPVRDHRLSAGDAQAPASADPQVHFYGFRQIRENPIFYALADAFVLPSLYEEWGLVVNEAMASGLPVIVSETAGCAEDLLENGPPRSLGRNGPVDASLSNGLGKRIRRNGFVFDPRSQDELAGIFRILEAQPALRQEMGAASREIVEKFSCRHFAENALRSAQTALAGR
jgi:1,2-diacylglycerol 3-alpha-glucosyltransferase